MKSEAQKEKERKEKEKKEKEKPKPAFEVASLNVLPGDRTSRQFGVKPGHWMSVTQLMKANNYNFSGRLTSAAVDARSRPLLLESAPYRLTMVRPASLTKGQPKELEFNYFVPRSLDRNSRTVLLNSRLLDSRGNELHNTSEGVRRIAAHQYYFLVLARNPDAYKYLDLLDSFRPPGEDIRDQFYYVVAPQTDGNLPLPGNPLAWTTIAHVLWDDVDPAALRPDQQQALIDWLHWGGQLTISGPGSLPGLNGSFLADYLPATMTAAVELEQADFDQLNQHLSLPDTKKQELSSQLTVAEGRPVGGAQLELAPDSQFVPDTGRLIAERRIGRGRIVVTAFPLTSRTVINWRNFDGFFNACILRHPARKFSKTELSEVKVDWRDAELRRHRLDPRLVTGLRMFSRDMGYVATPVRRALEVVEKPLTFDRFGNPVIDESDMTFDPSGDTVNLDEAAPEFQPEQGPTDVEQEPTIAWKPGDPPLPDGGYVPTPVSGMGGWDDFSGVAAACRGSLREAAGISIPKADFVLKVMAGYLLVLVPLNWLVFRLIGRVEWAWIAAPVIALIGTVAVVRLAQLDIGFARSRTEIAVLEVQGGHSRGHLTRFTALYTSFSTSYDLLYDDDTALAEPFAADPDFQYRIGQVTSEAVFRRDKQSSLRDFQVRSNSTGMVHSEQMLNMGGAFRLLEPTNGSWRLVNESNLALRDVGVLRRSAAVRNAEVEVAWVGVLEPQSQAVLKFGPPQDSAAMLSGWEESPATSSRYTPGEVNLRRVLNLARDPRRLTAGEVRMIGWTDRPLQGMTVQPAAAQSIERTLLVGQLRYPLWGPPRIDANTRRAVEAEIRRPDDDDQPDELNLFGDEPTLPASQLPAN